MKKRLLLGLLPAILALSSCAGTATNNEVKEEGFFQEDTLIRDDLFAKSESVFLSKETKKLPFIDETGPKIGVQKSIEYTYDAKQCVAFRFVAAVKLTDLAEASVQWDRAVYTNEGAVHNSIIGTLDVEKAYETIVDGDASISASSLGDYTHFVTYTLRNVPVTKQDYVVTASLTVNGVSNDKVVASSIDLTRQVSFPKDTTGYFLSGTFNGAQAIITQYTGVVSGDAKAAFVENLKDGDSFIVVENNVANERFQFLSNTINQNDVLFTEEGNNIVVNDDGYYALILNNEGLLFGGRGLVFDNDSSTRDKLILSVEATTSEHPWISNFCDGNIDSVEGRYLFISESGASSLYPFNYSLSGWNSDFTGDSGDVYDRLDGDDLKATIGEINFSSAAQQWHGAVIGNSVTKTYLDKQIASSNPRIAKMTPNEPGKNLDLYLVVLKTDNPDGFIWPKGGYEVNVTGKYVLVDRTNGDIIRIYNFKYHLDEGWTSSLSSNAENPGDYVISDEFRDGNVFTAVRLNPPSWEDWANFTLADADWKKAVLGRN